LKLGVCLGGFLVISRNCKDLQSVKAQRKCRYIRYISQLDLRIDEHFVIRVFNYRATSKTFGRKVTGTCAVNSDVIACKKAP